MIIDANVLTEPRAFEVSKVNRSNVKGITVITLAQGLFNQHTDRAFYEQAIDSDPTSLLTSTTSKITYSGNIGQIKVGGSKTFTVTFYDGDEAPVDYQPGEWSIIIDGEESDLATISYPAENKAKVKLKQDDSLIGKILTVTHTSGEITASADVEIIAL